MKGKITTFINELILYDYILFGSVFCLFILFIILSLLLRKKLVMSIFLALSAFAILFLGFTVVYVEMHKFLYENTTTLLSQKKLTFTKAIVVKGEIINNSKFNFKSCTITADAYKVTGNKMKDFLFEFKPIRSGSVVVTDILKGQKKEFKLFIEPFTYSKDYNISVKGRCK